MPIPYLHFRGDCAKALAFYAETFGTPAPQLMRYAEAPAMPYPDDPDRVIHGQVLLPDGMLMASDFPPGVEGDPQQAVSLMLTAPDDATARDWYAKLGEDGQPILHYGPTFFSRGFGMVKDRFGTHWMISLPPEEPLDATADA